MKKEHLIATLVAVLVILFVNAPILYFSFVGKLDLTFLGRRVINSQDMYTYLSFIEQSRQGKLIFENLYTTEPQSPTIIRPVYLAIGTFARFTHTSSLQSYQLARVLASLYFCFILYLFISELFQREKQRVCAFLLVLTSSGLGWLLGRFINQSSDLWIPESNVFMSLAESPHFIFSQALMLTVLYCYVRFLKTKRSHLPIVILICCALLAFDHPFDLMILGPVLFFTGLLSSAALAPTFLLSFFSVIGIAYPLYQLRVNPVFASEQAQGVSLSPSPMAFLSGFGMFIPLALSGANTWLLSRRASIKLILLWSGIGIVMMYAPVGFQRRLSEGISIPISLLAAAGLFQLYSVIKSYRVRLAVPCIAAITIFLLLGSVQLVITDFQTIGKDSKASYYYFVSTEEYEGLTWLREHTQPTDVILSNWFYGNLIPGTSGRRVYVGHKAQTITFEDKVARINSFLLEKDDEKSQSFLRENSITYIYVGNNDSLLQYGYHPESKSYLEKVFDKGGARIFKVLQK